MISGFVAWYALLLSLASLLSVPLQNTLGIGVLLSSARPLEREIQFACFNAQS